MAGALTRMLGRQASAAAAWTPLSLPGLKAWYDASTETEADDAIVSTLHDRSGNGFDMANSSTFGTNSPRMESSGFAPYKYIQFNGSFSGTRGYYSGTITMTGATEGSYAAVAFVTADPSVDPDNGPILDRIGATSRWPQTDGTILEGFGTTSLKTIANPSPSLTVPRIYSAHSATSDYRAYLDGTNIHTTTTNTVSFGTTSRYIGASSDLGNAFKGYIGDLIISTNLWSTGDRQKVEGYLAHKYGLTANLPVGHPYISSPP